MIWSSRGGEASTLWVAGLSQGAMAVPIGRRACCRCEVFVPQRPCSSRLRCIGRGWMRVARRDAGGAVSAPCVPCARGAPATRGWDGASWSNRTNAPPASVFWSRCSGLTCSKCLRNGKWVPGYF